MSTKEPKPQLQAEMATLEAEISRSEAYWKGEAERLTANYNAKMTTLNDYWTVRVQQLKDEYHDAFNEYLNSAEIEFSFDETHDTKNPDSLL